MFHDLRNPLTLKILALGRPLFEAERIAAVITVWVVLLWAMTGNPVATGGVPQQARDEWSRPGGIPGQGRIGQNICGIFPAPAGTAGRPARTLLHR